VDQRRALPPPLAGVYDGGIEVSVPIRF